MSKRFTLSLSEESESYSVIRVRPQLMLFHLLFYLKQQLIQAVLIDMIYEPVIET